VSFDLPGSDMIGVPRDAMVALRTLLFRSDSTAAASSLYEAGYAGGGALHDAFVRWCRSKKLPIAENMATSEFALHASAFFSELGMGALEVGTLHDAAVTLDSTNWAEAEPSTGMQFPGCYLSSGMLTEFLSRLAGSPVTVIEVECRSMGAKRCRFLVGSAETIQQVYEGITQGTAYEVVLQSSASSASA
jgi:predicted hydrocarbon binding protein